MSTLCPRTNGVTQQQPCDTHRIPQGPLAGQKQSSSVFLRAAAEDTFTSVRRQTGELSERPQPSHVTVTSLLAIAALAGTRSPRPGATLRIAAPGSNSAPRSATESQPPGPGAGSPPSPRTPPAAHLPGLVLSPGGTAALGWLSRQRFAFLRFTPALGMPPANTQSHTSALSVPTAEKKKMYIYISL